MKKMPVAGAGGGDRQTFRPPWVKDGPPPIPLPTQPWVKSNRNAPGPQTADTKEAAGVVKKALRRVSDNSGKPHLAESSATEPKKSSKVIIIPSIPKENGNSSDVSDPTPKKSDFSDKSPVELTRKMASETPKTNTTMSVAAPTQLPASSGDKVIPIERIASRSRMLERSRTSDKYEGLAVSPKPPIAPPMPPPPPPLPGTKEMLPEKPTISTAQAQKLESLRSRPKRRPDWGNLMKEIEVGKKLSHVVCYDRSSPLLPKVKAKGQFVYESERPNLHNQLLKQIESGVKLKPTKTNDRSRPFIEGLRKFRRQMTIEEQIQKSTSMASMGIPEMLEPDPLDEVDDIDKVRDDLQSTKQLLAMELKNKEALERENKKLLTRILNLEVELEKKKNEVPTTNFVKNDDSAKELEKLRAETDKAKKIADEMESKVFDLSGQIDLVKLDLQEATEKNMRLERQLKVAQAANLANAVQVQPITKQPSSRKIIEQKPVKANHPALNDDTEEDIEDEEEETDEDTETESENEVAEEDELVVQERRQARELKLLSTKLKSLKDKKEAAKKERKALKEQQKKQLKALQDEKIKYKMLQIEVDKMSKLLNEDDVDDDDEENVELAETEEETDSDDSETDESESESEESDEALPESAPFEKRKANIQSKVKRYENFVSSLKKGNYLLKANVDRYKDELNKQKEMSISLQEDLNSVLTELG